MIAGLFDLAPERTPPTGLSQGAWQIIGIGMMLAGVALILLAVLAKRRAPAKTAAPEEMAWTPAQNRPCAPRIHVSCELGDRRNQQDTYAYPSGISQSKLEEAGLLGVVCDGMGGMQGGEIASRLCAETMLNSFYNAPAGADPFAVLKSAACEADGKVAALTGPDGQPLNGGTTLVAVAARNDQAYWISVGDSRIYRFREGKLTRVTRDHNYGLTLQELLAAGRITRAEAENHPKREALISYVGKGGLTLIDMDVFPFSPQNGDCVILCSDGLTKVMNDEEIESLAASVAPENLATVLTREALKRTWIKHDNTTVMTICCG